MRVALDGRGIAPKLTFEFADTAQELAVELALVDQLLRLSGKCPFG